MALNTILSHPDQDSYVTIAEANSFLLAKPQYSKWSKLSEQQKEAYLKAAAQQMDAFRYKSIKMYPKARDYRKEQGLAFPRYFVYDMFQGRVVFATSTTFTINDYLTSENVPDDVFNGGSIIITDGTGKGQTVAITDWVFATGTGTVTGWTTQPDNTSQVLLILPIDKKVKYAQIEQAYFLALNKDKKIEDIMQGVASYKIGHLSENFDKSMMTDTVVNGVPFSNMASGYLKGLIDRTGYIAY